MKRIFSIAATIIIVLSLSSCKHGDPSPSKKTFLTVVAADPNKYGASDAWVFATDNAGNVLAVAHNTTGEVQLQSAAVIPDSVNLTFFYFADYSSSGAYPNNYSLTTYASIPKNSTMEFKKDTVLKTSPPSIGKAFLTITGYHNENTSGPSFTYSDGYQEFAGTDHPDNFTNTVSVDLQGHPDVLVTGYNENIPLYTWFKNVQPGDTLSQEFGSFSTFPKTIALNFDGFVFGYIGAQNEGDFSPYFLSFIEGTVRPDFVPYLGYLDGFDKYTMEISSTVGQGANQRSVFYDRIGILTQDVQLPANSLHLTSSTLNNLTFTFDGAFNFKQSQWSYSDNSTIGMLWEINSGKGTTPAFTSFPTEIRAAHPTLNFSLLKHDRTSLYQSRDGYTYQDLVIEFFGGPPKDTREYYTFQAGSS